MERRAQRDVIHLRSIQLLTCHVKAMKHDPYSIFPRILILAGICCLASCATTGGLLRDSAKLGSAESLAGKQHLNWVINSDRRVRDYVQANGTPQYYVIDPSFGVLTRQFIYLNPEKLVTFNCDPILMRTVSVRETDTLPQNIRLLVANHKVNEKGTKDIMFAYFVALDRQIRLLDDGVSSPDVIARAAVAGCTVELQKGHRALLEQLDARPSFIARELASLPTETHIASATGMVLKKRKGLR